MLLCIAQMPGKVPKYLARKLVKVVVNQYNIIGKSYIKIRNVLNDLNRQKVLASKDRYPQRIYSQSQPRKCFWSFPHKLRYFH